MYKHTIKRMIDVILSGIAIVLLAIPMLLIAVVVKIESPGPAIFKQERVGLKGNVFSIYKFQQDVQNVL